MMAPLSTEALTFSLNHWSTPRFTRTPNTRAISTDGISATIENRATKRRCRRDPASSVLRARVSTRRPTMKASPAINARLAISTIRAISLLDPRAAPPPAPGATATSQIAAAVIATARK